MNNTYQYITKSIVAIVFATMLFSCQNRLNQVRSWDKDELAAQTSGEGINLFYTDSGNVKANLRSPYMLDFSNQEFPYREFPKGLEVEFFDENNKKNTVIADYGIVYQETGLVDLQGNVEIVTSDSTVLHAKQLYWDQKQQWVFSDIDYSIKMKSGALNDGEGFDANENFNKFNSRSNTGIQYIDQDKK